MKTLEVSKTCSYGGDYDVVVCGGGPAGVCAAISAAREGAKTLLIERNGELGGFWTSGLLTWLADVDEKPGLVKEIVDEMGKCCDGRVEYRDKAYFTADTEGTKILFERLCEESGVDIRLYTLVTGVIKDGNRIKSVVTDSKSGTEYFDARFVIDATGDGDVGALAGCEFYIGNDEGKTQPMSMIALIGGIKYEDVEKHYATHSDCTQNTCIFNEFERAGVTPSYIKPLLAPVSKENNLFALMMNHEYGASAVDANDLTKSTMHARKEIYSAIDALRKLGGIWKDVHVITSASNIGVREGRRIKGKYYITRENDLAQGKVHEDGVCKVGYSMDIHQYSADSEKEDFKKRHAIKVYPYEIPLRALISDEVEGLMMAGRCISGDSYSYGNFRVGGNAARTGEAAGTAAGYSAVHNIAIEETVPIIKELLKKHDK